MFESDADRYLAKTGMADAVRYAWGQWRKLREDLRAWRSLDR
ncbi:hypothetical protein [Pelagicoccus mobilis]|nr:hypothetical protein [Pelagicoccus mobilis]